ncbi:MAG TPA: PDZ domain-containing protein [Gemmatimonadaceae bacterium]|nr:PDZ domain-containing protein [Gemmatimonadaceae bacterium]
MVRSIRTPLCLTITVVAATGAPLRAPLVAQRAEVGAMRRAPRAEPVDTNERQLRRLERKADSLSQLYNEGDDLSIAQRRSIGDELDRTVGQIEELARRMAQMDSRLMRVQVQVAPMVDERNAMAMSNALRQAQQNQIPLPRGWLGIVVSGTAREPRVDNGELIIRYLTHPVIVSVEPSSPAEKAGLIPTDTLIAYDGRDVRDRDISITRLLRPNARVLVRVRRDGRTKDVPVTIADVPSRIRLRSETNFVLRTPRADPALPGVAFPRSPVPVNALAPRASAAPPMAPVPPMPEVEAMRAPAVTPGMIVTFGLNGVAGAQLAALTEGLARTVGVRRGVLVTYAAVGSPAYTSGLRDGDVIVRVGGEPVSTVAQLRERVQMAVENGENSVKLDCVRDRKARGVTLRWNDDR